jgi:hypothetical protein
VAVAAAATTRWPQLWGRGTGIAALPFVRLLLLHCRVLPAAPLLLPLPALCKQAGAAHARERAVGRVAPAIAAAAATIVAARCGLATRRKPATKAGSAISSAAAVHHELRVVPRGAASHAARGCGAATGRQGGSTCGGGVAGEGGVWVFLFLCVLKRGGVPRAGLGPELSANAHAPSMPPDAEKIDARRPVRGDSCRWSPGPWHGAAVATAPAPVFDADAISEASTPSRTALAWPALHEPTLHTPAACPGDDGSGASCWAPGGDPREDLRELVRRLPTVCPDTATPASWGGGSWCTGARLGAWGMVACRGDLGAPWWLAGACGVHYRWVGYHGRNRSERQQASSCGKWRT